MSALSLETIQIIAWSKVLLFLAVIVALLIVRFKNKPWAWSLFASITVTASYLIISWPLQKMWWGNNGDEIFIISFFTQALKSNPFQDYYYLGLPAFYPPLYFQVIGLVSRLWAANAISAAKFGTALTFFLWFSGTYLGLRLCRGKQSEKSSSETLTPWLWFTIPLLFFFLVDFNDLILKPYETFPALLSVFWLGLLWLSLNKNRWSIKEYLFFGISGGILFLTYYFWWLILVPALIGLALTHSQRLIKFLRIIIVGFITFIISGIYLVPLFLSYKSGMENWQALFFVPQDFSTFLPFVNLSIKTPLLIAGLLGLIIYCRRPFVRANLAILITCYLYQIVSLVLFLAGGHPFQAAKPFLFLGTATLTVGCAYSLSGLWNHYVTPLTSGRRQIISLALIVLSLPFWPMTTFIDDVVVRNQIEKDLKAPSAYYLASHIQQAVPDYQNKIWLSSGIPEINAYLPLHYFIAHNPHFSHPAAKYSEREKVLKELVSATAANFTALVRASGINALLLYKTANSDSYPLFLWADNYPNGGLERELQISKVLIDSLHWRTVYEDSEWQVIIP
ncbi:MAG: arabinofuranosyltransferase [Candidatus Komeilibacteria bacterium]